MYGATHRDDVERAVTDAPHLRVLVVHQVDEVGGRLRLPHDHLARRLVEDHLVEDVDDLQHHLVVFLLRCRRHTATASADGQRTLAEETNAASEVHYGL